MTKQTSSSYTFTGTVFKKNSQSHGVEKKTKFVSGKFHYQYFGEMQIFVISA